MKEVEFEKTEVKKVIEVVDKTKVKIDKVSKITTETAPNYVVYNMEVISEGKPFEVTVIDTQ